ncbi:zinc dependent phospholipase C family protein [Clostridium paraputrificum]|uniref:zinc dependent phospholipase C family protein n=1 Tax=Clostridium paraputrificum TaxID=29363 RepID=UPI003D34C009
MLISTHKILATNILKHANGKKLYLINKKRFIWGNIKPDCASKYKFKKHYYEESIDMIIDKINFLSSLSVRDIYFDYGKGKFSEELGVVCHFLCDYFCMPHNQRWEFKNSMKKHVHYENKLARIAKTYKVIDYIDTKLNMDEVREFIEKNRSKYEIEKSYKSDLNYSYYVCNSIINSLMNQILINEYVENRRAS